MKRVAVGEICNLVNGKAFKPTDWSKKGAPIIRIQNLNDNTKPFNYWAGSLDRQVKIKTGDVLLAWSGTPGTSFGVHIWKGGNGILNQHIFRVDLDESLVTSDWFKHAVNDRLHELIAQAHGGVGLQHVTRPMVDRLQIPLPPLDEQMRIAAILDKADQLRQKRRQAIALLDSLTQSIFLEMFGDPVSNPKGWEVHSLADVANLTSGGTPAKSSPSFWEGQIPWVSPKDMKSLIIRDAIDHISETAVRQSATKLAAENTILIVVRGMILAHSVPIGILSREAAFNQDIKAIRFNQRIDPRFGLWNLLSQRSSILQNVSTAAHGTKRLEMDVVFKLPVLCPPTALQKQFAKQYDLTAQNLTRLNEASAKADHLFRSLQSTLFLGEKILE